MKQSKNTKKDTRLSLNTYWVEHLKGIMCDDVFYRECKILFADPEFAKEFGRYRGRKLSPKQVELLNREFL